VHVPQRDRRRRAPGPEANPPAAEHRVSDAAPEGERRRQGHEEDRTDPQPIDRQALVVLDDRAAKDLRAAEQVADPRQRHEATDRTRVANLPADDVHRRDRWGIPGPNEDAAGAVRLDREVVPRPDPTAQPAGLASFDGDTAGHTLPWEVERQPDHSARLNSGQVGERGGGSGVRRGFLVRVQRQEQPAAGR
jgi:hypothetical protein